MSLPQTGNQTMPTGADTQLTLSRIGSGSVYLVLKNFDATNRVYFSVTATSYSGNEAEYCMLPAGKETPITVSSGDAVYFRNDSGSSVRVDWTVNSNYEI